MHHPSKHSPLPNHPPLGTPGRLVLAYKNFAAQKGISHIGLGVAALNTAKCLRAVGVETHVWPITGPPMLAAQLAEAPETTHVVISAPWISAADLMRLAQTYPNTQFVVNCHSNVGFLQADSTGVQVFKELLHAEQGTWNIRVSGNSEKFANWVRSAFDAPCLYLPNLYYLGGHGPHRSHHQHEFVSGVLKIGAFGATRPLKNLISAGAAAMQIAADLRADLQFWISGGREDGGAVMVRALRKLFEGQSTMRLMEAPWAPWPEFRTRYVKPMHLMLQPSYTESFNMVTADGISQGVPSVVSPAIDWAPKHWQANPDDISDIARVGLNLLRDRHAIDDGVKALEAHNAVGLRQWLAFISN